jgi:hypothetical protein
MMPATIFLRVAYRPITRDLQSAQAVAGPGAFSVARSSVAYMWIRQLANGSQVQESITMLNAASSVQNIRRGIFVQVATILIVILDREWTGPSQTESPCHFFPSS